MNFKITKEEAEKLLAYLAQRPFIEVHQLVPILQRLPLIKEIEEKAEALTSEVKTELLKPLNN